jgi:hypothetical protein
VLLTVVSCSARLLLPGVMVGTEAMTSEAWSVLPFGILLVVVVDSARLILEGCSIELMDAVEVGGKLDEGVGGVSSIVLDIESSREADRDSNVEETSADDVASDDVGV